MSLFETGRNAWHVERADRAAVLIDAAPYFGAVREALKKAQRTIFILGWDINSRIRLVGPEGKADDGYPETFSAFLAALVKERPELRVNILLWDFSVLYSMEREVFPSVSLGWRSPPGIQLCLDDALPLGSAHHQKIVVVDDCIAFSGGLDLTDRRWDTNTHDFDNPVRVDLQGKPYRPFHDVQMVVDGGAARQIARLARLRWQRATFERVPEVRAGKNCWPDGLRPDFVNTDIAIALTQPAYDSIPERREVEQLFLDSIALAEREIYIENQFVTRKGIAERLIARMHEKPDLEVLIMAPHTHESWIEARTMRVGRIAFRRAFADAGLSDRIRFAYPLVTRDGEVTDTMIHSKVMIVDDVFLRVGSANLNNRSMGTDTECDLAIHAANDRARAAIRRIRNTLIADHCGVSAADVEEGLLRTGSLLATAETLEGRGHCLRPIEDGEPDPEEIAAAIQAVADPERTVGIEEFMRHLAGSKVPYRQLSHTLQVAIGCLIVIGLVAAWRYTPLVDWTDPERLRAAATNLSSSIWAPAIVIIVFVLGGFVLFPLTVLIAVTAATFGPWLGLLYAGTGALVSSLTTYVLGARLGQETLRNLIGPRLNRVARRVAKKGVLAVATVRLVPIAPFTVVNLVAGASGIRLIDFVIGTVLGLLPGLIVLSSLGNQIFEVLADPSFADIALFLALVVVWIGVSFGLQIAVSKMRTAKG